MTPAFARPPEMAAARLRVQEFARQVRP